MKTKIEGLLLYKISYRERDLIGDLLLRNGRKISVIFYDGGGGATSLELGYMLRVEVNPSRFRKGDLYTTREWKLIWCHQNIRLKYRAFYLLCVYLEIVRKATYKIDLSFEDDEKDSSEILSILGHALLFLDRHCTFDSRYQLGVFLLKLFRVLGIFPQTEFCFRCRTSLISHPKICFVLEQGSFLCQNCSSSHSSDKEIFDLILKVKSLKYQDLHQGHLSSKIILIKLFDHFCYRFNIEKRDFKAFMFYLKS